MAIQNHFHSGSVAKSSTKTWSLSTIYTAPSAHARSCWLQLVH